MEKELKDKVTTTVMNCLDRADKLESGSAARAKEITTAGVLISKLNEDYRNEEEALDKHTKTDYEHEIAIREVEVKEFVAEDESEARRKISNDTKVKLLAVGGLILAERIIEAKGQLVPKYLNKFWPKVF